MRLAPEIVRFDGMRVVMTGSLMRGTQRWHPDGFPALDVRFAVQRSTQVTQHPERPRREFLRDVGNVQRAALARTLRLLHDG
jgi:hypothetical protein